MPAVSKKQQRFFGYLLSNPEERKKRGISKKAAKDFAQDVQEVAPPGWGHTKAEKEKTKPDKPKSKIGGTAAAFKRALDDGRFKGLPGSKTKKEKTADMFKLMWSMKKKGDKPHYKPGTDEKYKKYQEEGASIIQGGTSSKKVSYRGPTAEKSKPKKSVSYRGEKDERIPRKNRHGVENKSARYGSQLHRLRPRSERVKEDWKPEIEHSKLGDAVKKKAEKKRKEAASSLPPHLRLDAMKKAFAHTNEETVKEGSSIIQGRKSSKKSTYRGPTGDHERNEKGWIKASHYKKKKTIPAGPQTKTKKVKQSKKPKQKLPWKPKTPEERKAILRKFDNYKKTKAGALTNKLLSRYRNVKEELTPMQDNNLFGNAYAGSSPPKKKKNKKLKESSFQDYMAQAQAARDREKKRREDRKKADAQYADTKKHGVRFYDKKGKGRIKSGKKIYDK